MLQIRTVTGCPIHLVQIQFVAIKPTTCLSRSLEDGPPDFPMSTTLNEAKACFQALITLLRIQNDCRPPCRQTLDDPDPQPASSIWPLINQTNSCGASQAGIVLAIVGDSYVWLKWRINRVLVFA